MHIKYVGSIKKDTVSENDRVSVLVDIKIFIAESLSDFFVIIFHTVNLNCYYLKTVQN